MIQALVSEALDQDRCFSGHAWQFSPRRHKTPNDVRERLRDVCDLL